MKRTNLGLVLSLMLCTFLLAGCWGKREVEELAPLIGVGFDLGQKPGTYLITEQFSLPQKGGATGVDIKNRSITVETASAREAFEMISKIFFRIPFMGSLKVVVIGEDVARAGFNDILDFSQRYSEFRRSLYLVVTKGKAQSLLNMELRSGKLPAMYLKENIESGSIISTSPKVHLGHYLTILARKSTAPIIPLVKSVKSGEGGIEYKAEGQNGAAEMQIEGAGVFRADRLADFLTDQECKGYMWLENNIIHRSITTVGIEASKVSFGGQVLESTTKYKVKDNDGTIGLDYQIKAIVAVDEVLGLKQQLSEAEWLELLKGAEKSFALVIQKECELSIQKERALQLDYLGIGRHIEQRNPKYWKTIKDQWEAKIPDFPVSLNVQVKIHNSGMSSSSATTN